ncbi:MAG: MBL fold metallo-hydrolase [Chitinophagaceae bacterium]|nr:MBL fold metallo-hydrolase [Chitinophagaceae bacterium]
MYIDWYSVAPGIWRIKDVFVNIYLIHNPSEDNWVLVDAGLKTSAKKVVKVAEQLFWPNISPSAIILTHAHFDHVGSLRKLADKWNVPVYAHKMEQPYLTGKSSYPPPDPFVGGGLVSLLSFVYPRGPIDISDRFEALPDNGTVPGLPGWKYFHTPGHAPGHISLFRESDRVLIAGDAFVTTKQESAIGALLQPRKLSGPPKYFTYNWNSAERSVKLLADLDPSIVATGHGYPMSGDGMRRALYNLAENFRDKAVPATGRYVNDPALINSDGVQYVPPAGNKGIYVAAAALIAIALASFIVIRKRKYV